VLWINLEYFLFQTYFMLYRLLSIVDTKQRYCCYQTKESVK